MGRSLLPQKPNEPDALFQARVAMRGLKSGTTIYRERAREYLRQYQADPRNKDKIRGYGISLRLAALQKVYRGTGPLRCECPKCTVTDDRSLEIDHIHGGGRKGRKGGGFYQKILRLSLVEVHANFQILCSFCNHARAKTVGNSCPHLGGFLPDVGYTSLMRRDRKVRAVDHLGGCNCEHCNKDPIMASSLWAFHIHHLDPALKKVEKIEGADTRYRLRSLILRTPQEEARRRWAAWCPNRHAYEHRVVLSQK